jgi:hypothetical protein
LEFVSGKNRILLCTGPSGTDYSLDLGNQWQHLQAPGYHTMDVGKHGLTVWAAGSNGRVGKLIYNTAGKTKEGSNAEKF